MTWGAEGPEHHIQKNTNKTTSIFTLRGHHNQNKYNLNCTLLLYIWQLHKSIASYELWKLKNSKCCMQKSTFNIWVLQWSLEYINTHCIFVFIKLICVFIVTLKNKTKVLIINLLIKCRRHGSHPRIRKRNLQFTASGTSYLNYSVLP